MDELDDPKGTLPFCGETSIPDATSLGATHTERLGASGEGFWQPEGRGSTTAHSQNHPAVPPPLQPLNVLKERRYKN